MKYILISLFLATRLGFGQVPDSTYVDGKKIVSELLHEVTVKPLILNKKERHKYHKLKKKVLKVYPYAQSARVQLQDIETDLSYASSKKHKRKIAKLHTRWVKEKFSKDLMKLTRSEGRILTKLIYRETGISCYELIKKYRNGLSAKIWQRMAKFYDGDLKSNFDPETNKQDQWIEHILWKQYQLRNKLVN